MNLRRLRDLAHIAIAVYLCGCVTVTKTSTGDFEFEERFETATKQIIEKSGQAEEAALTGHRASVDPRVEQFVQRHFLRADELVMSHMEEVKKAVGGHSFASFLDDYARRRAVLLQFTLKLQPSLVIVESKFANATAFPTGRILLNRPLAEGFDVSKEGFDSVLLGILIHELMHVRDGHALEQWATSDSRQAWATDKVIGAVTSLTKVIPFLSINYDIQYPLTFGATKQLPTLSEYAADIGAVSLLDKAGFDSGRYIAFLSEMSANAMGVTSKTGSSLLRQRAECLGQFSKSRFEEGLEGIVVGSSDAGDRMVQSLDLSVYRKVFSLLDSPDELAKLVPGKSVMSGVERRSILSAAVKKAIFTGCAIKRSFPDAAVKEGVLVTPTFDLSMFVQHF